MRISSTVTRRLNQEKLRMPLRENRLRCDHTRKLIGGMYGWTRQHAPGVPKFHHGIDLVAEPGTPCYSIYRGSVILAEHIDGWGNTVVIEIEFPRWTCWALYAHLEPATIRPGFGVEPGTVVGHTGISGNPDAAYPHLHFEILRSKQGLVGQHRKHKPQQVTLDPLHVLGPVCFQPEATQIIERNQRRQATA